MNYKLIKISAPESRKFYLPCNCGSGGTISVTAFERLASEPVEILNWPAADYEEVYINTEGEEHGPWKRFKAMWTMFWTGKFENCGISASRKGLEGLRDWINATLAYWDQLEAEDKAAEEKEALLTKKKDE